MNKNESRATKVINAIRELNRVLKQEYFCDTKLKEITFDECTYLQLISEINNEYHSPFIHVKESFVDNVMIMDNIILRGKK